MWNCQEIILFITNFPNPFNPVTKIYYSIPKEGKLRITVFNSVGQIVKELLNEFKSVGYYTVDFDGSNLSSGIYYCKMETDDFVETKKMLLIK